MGILTSRNLIVELWDTSDLQTWLQAYRGHSFKGMSYLWRYVILVSYVILVKVCQICEGMSYLWRYVTLVKVSYLLRYVILVKVCHTCEGSMSDVWRYVTLLKECNTFEAMSCHTFKGMSHLRRYVTLEKVCHTCKGVSNQ